MACLHKAPGLPSVTDYCNEELKSQNTKGSGTALLWMSELTSESDLSLCTPKEGVVGEGVGGSYSIIQTEVFYLTCGSMLIRGDRDERIPPDSGLLRACRSRGVTRADT